MDQLYFDTFRLPTSKNRVTFSICFAKLVILSEIVSYSFLMLKTFV